ncbi:hypothetical protein MASR1M12_44270 [Erysipelotrichia bacterium]|jgi:hypothetical protein
MKETIDPMVVLQQFKDCFRTKGQVPLPDPKLVIMLIETNPTFIKALQESDEMFRAQVSAWASMHLNDGEEPSKEDVEKLFHIAKKKAGLK